ncbi:unnamed protein product [Aphanomyces euteiches]
MQRQLSVLASAPYGKSVSLSNMTLWSFSSRPGTDGTLVHSTLSIPLKPTDKPVAHFPSSFYATLLKEYATKYLEEINALPTPENIALVAQNMPLQKCRVSAAWKSRGCLSDVLTISPESVCEVTPSTKQSFSPESTEPAAPPRRNPPPEDAPHVFGTDLDKNYIVGHVHWSFNDLKRRFVYPFNQIYKVPIVEDKDGFPMAKPISFSPLPDRRVYKPSAAALTELFHPPSTLTFDVIAQLQMTFFAVIPFDMVEMTDANDQQKLQQYLTSSTTLHLIGFLAHYLYWTIMRPLAAHCASMLSTPVAADGAPPASSNQESPLNVHLTPNDIEQLFVSFTNSFETIKAAIATEMPAKSTKPTPPILPLLVFSLRVTIDTIFRTTYPTWLDSNSLRIEPTLLAVGHRLDELLDPHGYLDRIGPLEATADAINFTRTHAFKVQKRHGARLRDSFFATSHTMQAAMPNPLPGTPRRLVMHGSGGTASLAYHRRQTKSPPTTYLSLGNRMKLLKVIAEVHESPRKQDQ